ncbi:hypothetical protein [Agromyces sp. H66]|uniref:hypothetical protein n=1 Tax=Agromyces sp. H66 TaxID=2529859 RepID=UPI0010A9C0AC|nr:hypothetical protein [Agromyces sp. H66]
MTTTPTAPLSVAARRQLDIFQRFVEGVDVRRAPANLRRPHSMGEWARLSAAERLAHAEQRSRELTAPKTAKLAPSKPAAPKPEAVRAFRPGERLALSDVSGEWLPIAEIRREEAAARAARRAA